MSLPGHLLPQGEILLVSCNNLGGFGSRYSLAVVSAEGVSWLDLDAVIDPSTDSGIAGIFATQHDCFLAIQSARPRIVRLDRKLKLGAQTVSERGGDFHSLVERDGVIYAASTGRNEILAFGCPEGRFTGGERVLLRAAPQSKNSIHLNSLCFADGELLYSMFGHRHGTVRSGALVNASTGAVLCDGLRDPHSLTDLGDGRIAFCESLTASFCLLDLPTGVLTRTQVSGYTRGCTFTGRHFVVGSSRWRHRSRSLGSLREEPASVDPHGNPWQRSALYFLNPDLSIAHRLDFTKYAPEIYDVAYVGTRFNPASVFEDAAARRLDAMYDEIHRETRPSKTDYSKRA